MRIILFTGKGGVGKTTVSAATAIRLADLGYRTIVLSTDAAHSLSDSLDMPIGWAPTRVLDNLFAQEIDVNQEIKRNWGPIKHFIEQFLKSRGFSDVIAEELSVFPGMEEVFSMLLLKDIYLEAEYDVVVIDCAPTGDTLRFLSVPDVAKWYMEKIFHIERRIFKAIRPIAQRFVDPPLPSDDVFASIEKLYINLRGVKDLLTDPDISSVRIVTNPEKMVLKESQRAYTFLHLFGFSIDSIILNRVFPKDATKDQFVSSWVKIQETYLKSIEESFSPLPILFANQHNKEIFGIDALREFAFEIYKDKDPKEIFYKEKPVEIVQEDSGYYLWLKLPFIPKEDFEIWSRGDELTIKIKNFKRTFLLPRALYTRKIVDANFENGGIKIRFGGENGRD